MEYYTAKEKDNLNLCLVLREISNSKKNVSNIPFLKKLKNNQYHTLLRDVHISDQIIKKQ